MEIKARNQAPVPPSASPQGLSVPPGGPEASLLDL